MTLALSVNKAHLSPPDRSARFDQERERPDEGFLLRLIKQVDDVGRVDGVKGGGEMGAFAGEIWVEDIGFEEAGVEVLGAVVVECIA